MGLLGKMAEPGARRGLDRCNIGVLVVDDMKEHREIYRRVLIDEGYSKIYMASNGAECLSIMEAKGDKIYVVLLDMMLPDTSAADILRHVVSFQRHAVGIVVNTGYPSEESRIELSGVGSEIVNVTAYMEKSEFDIHSILTEVQRAERLILIKRAAIAARNAEGAYEPIHGFRLGLVRIKSMIQGEISRLSSMMPDLVPSIGLGVVRTLALAILIVILLKLDENVKITAMLAKFID